jgi:hypothetical protein
VNHATGGKPRISKPGISKPDIRRSGVRKPRSWKSRVRESGIWKFGIAVAGLAVLLPILLAGPARAADGPPPTSCVGRSCYIWLYSHVQYGGSGYSPGADNPIPVQPPPCRWVPEGTVQPGSRALISYYNNTAPAQTAPNGQYASYTQAQQMIASHSTEKGEWYFRPDQPGQSPALKAECASEPLWFFAVPGEPLPGGTLAPVSLAELAAGTLLIPGAGQMELSPKNGPTYSNLPTFLRVTFNQAYDIGPGGEPYVTDNAAVQGEAATVWVIAEPLQLSTDDTTAKLYLNCGYLGSNELELHPAQVAATGANGTADCGVTFHQPGTWRLTATLQWRTCWVPEQEFGPPPPPAACHPVPGADLNPVTWVRNVPVHEIQAANGD